MHLCLFFFLAKSLYVVFGCTLSTNKMILINNICPLKVLQFDSNVCLTLFEIHTTHTIHTIHTTQLKLQLKDWRPVDKWRYITHCRVLVGFNP